MMKSDSEIAQEAVMLPIQEVAAQLDLTEDDLELYGKYKAKLSDDCLRRFSDQPDGKLILVTAIKPDPGGRGKDYYQRRIGEKPLVNSARRRCWLCGEPSLGPCFGIKGGRGRRRIRSGGAYGRPEPSL